MVIFLLSCWIDTSLIKQKLIASYPNGNIGALAWSHDGNLLAFSEVLLEDIVGIWNYEDRMIVETFAGDTFGVNSLTWSKDANYLAGSGNRVIVWNVDERENARLINYPENYSANTGIVDWSPDSRYLSFNWRPEAFEDDPWSYDIHILDTLTGNISRFGPQINPSFGFADWSPVSEIIAISEDGTNIQLWDFKQENIVAIMGTFSSLDMFAWNPNGQHFATVGVEAETNVRDLQIWDLATMSIIASKQDLQRDITSISWHPSLNTVALGALNTIMIWNVDDDKSLNLEVNSPEIDSILEITALSWHPTEAILASADNSGRIILWELMDCQR